jgi:hypothetical protein
VVFINYVMRITVGGMTTPVLIPLRLGNTFTERQIDPTITFVGAAVSNFTYFSVSCHLTKWASDAWRQSAPVNLGEPTAGIIVYRINGIQSAVLRPSGQEWKVDFPKGSTIMVLMDPEVSPFSQNQVYQLYVHNQYLFNHDQSIQMWNGIPYSDLTCVVTRIGIGAVGSWFGFAFSNTQRIIPKEIQEDIQFDKQNLTISHRMSFVVDNFDGSINLGNTFGEKAVNLRLGYEWPTLGLIQRFKGKARRYEWMRSSASQANVRVYCEDQMYQLRDSYSFAPPDMDGWNIYAAAAFLAQVAGIHALQMAFAILVPAIDPFTGGETTLFDNPNGMIDPDGVAPADPNFNPVTGQQGYFLPFGFGMRPWTPIDRVSSVLDLMNYIRQPIQALMFFDNNGALHFQPWFPPVAGVVKYTFTEFPLPDVTTGSILGPPLTEVWNTSVSWGSEDIRNVVSVIGVDSTAFSGSWNPIVTAIYDTDSIFNPNVFNYVGYRKAFVQMDSKFANFAFAAASCLNYFRVFRVPNYEANFECWLRPDVNPMDSIQLAEQKSGVVNIQLYVMSVQNIWTVLGGSMRFRTNIHAEYITPFPFFNPFGFGAQSALPEPEPVEGSLLHLYANQEHRETEAAAASA